MNKSKINIAANNTIFYETVSRAISIKVCDFASDNKQEHDSNKSQKSYNNYVQK